MNANKPSVIVIGGLNTDIVASGAKKLLNPGELTYASDLHIGPGGKSRNIAQMIAVLSEGNSVAMVGKTSKDPYGLWKVPVNSLKNAGVNIDYVDVVSFEKSGQFPGIALIPVDINGHNQIYVVPGINNSFLPADIDNADSLFKNAAEIKGMLVLTLELPYQTALYAVKKANELGIRVFFDPGGIDENKSYANLLSQKLFFLKPNEHEVKMLTGIEVNDFESARKAAKIFLQQQIENVFITHGVKGGYLFSKSLEKHIKIPNLPNSDIKDETGCGDQTMAAFVSSINEGNDLVTASEISILAGSLQFHKSGIQPITKRELLKFNS